MMAGGPFREWRACGHLRQADIDLLRALGVLPLALAEGPRGIGFALALDHRAVPVDLVAFHVGGMPFVGTWLGRVGLLGEEHIRQARDILQVHATLLDWLRGDREGVVVVDPVRAAPMLRDAGALEVESQAERRRLADMLTVRLPDIRVRPTARSAAPEVGMVDPGMLQLDFLHPNGGDMQTVRFPIGAADAMADTAISAASNGLNVYVEGRTVDVRASAGRGRANATRGVFAFVDDSDGEKGRGGNLTLTSSTTEGRERDLVEARSGAAPLRTFPLMVCPAGRVVPKTAHAPPCNPRSRGELPPLHSRRAGTRW